MKLFSRATVLPIVISFLVGLLVATLLTFLIYAPALIECNNDAYKIEQQLAVANQTIEDIDLELDSEIKDLKMQLRLVNDGASIEEAQDIISISKEAGVSPKY